MAAVRAENITVTVKLSMLARLALRALGGLSVLAPLLPDARDLHVYGGGLLVALGAWMTYPPAAPAVFGALLLYLGLRSPRVRKPETEAR